MTIWNALPRKAGFSPWISWPALRLADPSVRWPRVSSEWSLAFRLPLVTVVTALCWGTLHGREALLAPVPEGQSEGSRAEGLGEWLVTYRRQLQGPRPVWAPGAQCLSSPGVSSCTQSGDASSGVNGAQPTSPVTRGSNGEGPRGRRCNGVAWRWPVLRIPHLCFFWRVTTTFDPLGHCYGWPRVPE